MVATDALVDGARMRLGATGCAKRLNANIMRRCPAFLLARSCWPRSVLLAAIKIDISPQDVDRALTIARSRDHERAAFHARYIKNVEHAVCRAGRAGHRAPSRRPAGRGAARAWAIGSSATASPVPPRR